MRRIWIGLTLLVLIAVASVIGLIVANGPACLHLLQAPR
jgi:hypothetical protein